MLYKKIALHLWINNPSIKYNELHRLLRKFGCYETGRTIGGHPEWYSPTTNQKFVTSHHGKQEVASGTLRGIIKASGIELKK